MYGKPTAYCCQQIFDNVWLTYYPQPRENGFNNGGEFKAEFKELCDNMRLIKKTSIPWNQQLNTVLERIHQVLTDCLTIFEVEDLDVDKEDENPFEEYLTIVSYRIQCTFHKTHGHSLVMNSE